MKSINKLFLMLSFFITSAAYSSSSSTAYSFASIESKILRKYKSALCALKVAEGLDLAHVNASEEVQKHYTEQYNKAFRYFQKVCLDVIKMYKEERDSIAKSRLREKPERLEHLQKNYSKIYKKIDFTRI